VHCIVVLPQQLRKHHPVNFQLRLSRTVRGLLCINKMCHNIDVVTPEHDALLLLLIFQ
jgi:hypothetical protein